MRIAPIRERVPGDRPVIRKGGGLFLRYEEMRLKPGGIGTRLPFRWPAEETGKILLFAIPPSPVDAASA